MGRPLDLAVMHEERSALMSPWGTPHEWLEFSLINRHPCRRLVVERVVSRDIDAKCSVALRAFRSHAVLAHDEPWYDRIPEDSAVQRIGSLADLLKRSDDENPFPGYIAMMSEAIEHPAGTRPV